MVEMGKGSIQKLIQLVATAAVLLLADSDASWSAEPTLARLVRSGGF